MRKQTKPGRETKIEIKIDVAKILTVILLLLLAVGAIGIRPFPV